MDLSLSKHFNRKIARAVAEFNMIEDGDKILVGVSGGKDSSFLLYSLAVFREYFAIDFKLGALTVKLGFEGELDYSSLANWSSKLQVPHYIKKTKIADTLKAEETKNPCAKCSYFRKGVMTDFMKEKGYNKLAFGHHYDDAVETFLMSIIYSGQIKTFAPKNYLSRSDVHVIRPLVYMREREVVEANSNHLDFEPLKTSCPYAGTTKREEMKQLLENFDDKKQIFYNIASAMREGGKVELWPKELDREEIGRRLSELWRG